MYNRDEHASDMILIEGLRQVGWKQPEPLLMEATPVEMGSVDDRKMYVLPKKHPIVEAGSFSLQ